MKDSYILDLVVKLHRHGHGPSTLLLMARADPACVSHQGAVSDAVSVPANDTGP